MSESTMLNTFPVVTSLGSNDHLLATDSNGNAKRITAANVISTLDTVTVIDVPVGWLRIAQGIANQGMAGFLSVVSAPPQQSGIMIQFAIGQAASFQQPDLTVFGSGVLSNNTTTGAVFTKLRIVKPNSSSYPLYVDIYLAQSRTVTIRKSCDINIMISNFSSFDETNPERYSTVFEYNLSSIVRWGGVERWFSIGCKTDLSRLQEGGQHERKHDTYQRLPEGDDARCNGLSWRMSESRYSNLAGYLHDNGRNRMPVTTGRKQPLAICHIGSAETFQCHFSAAHNSGRCIFPSRKVNRYSALGQLESYDNVGKEAAA